MNSKQPIDRQLHRLLTRLHEQGDVSVVDGDDPEEELPGIRRAVQLRLVREDLGGGWSVDTVYSLTRLGRSALGEQRSPGFLDRLMSFWIRPKARP